MFLLFSYDFIFYFLKLHMPRISLRGRHRPKIGMHLTHRLLPVLAPPTTKKHKTFACALHTYHYNRFGWKCQLKCRNNFEKIRFFHDTCINICQTANHKTSGRIYFYHDRFTKAILPTRARPHGCTYIKGRFSPLFPRFGAQKADRIGKKAKIRAQ